MNVRNTVIFFINLFIGVHLLSAAEIMYEKDWDRLVSGGQAARLTRGITEVPVSTNLSEKTIETIFESLRLPVPEQNLLTIWINTIKSYGWAQFETEPEYQDYSAVQILVLNHFGERVVARQFDEQGKIAEIRCDLDGSGLSLKRLQQPQDNDRTVFSTVKSPITFVLNQEHFEKFFFESLINLEYPGFEKIKKAYSEKKTLLAVYELAEYFRNKQSNIWPVIEPSHDNLINDAAEMVLNHQFEYNDQLVTYGDHINWFDNPIDDSEWLWTLNRMPHWKTLLQGYIETTNESYAQEYNDEVLDWIIRNPAPAFRLTRVPAWRNLEAGIRCSSVWPETLYGFLASPSFQAHTIQLMLASLWSHAEHIYKFPSGMRFVNNWVIIESSGLAVVGMGFPEFINSEKWSAEGLSRLSEQLAKQVYPDGVQHELASGYHLSCLSSFCTAYEIAKKNNVQIPDSYSTTLEKMFDYLLYAATPSRELPPTNDSFRSNIVSWLKKGAALFNRPDMLFVAENGQEGTMPEKTSYHFPHAGQSIMRSNWSKNALYLFFDAGPYGVSHQHEDKLHIDVSAYGRDFITDAGKGSYVPDKWRSYFTSTAAHNTILIDGLGQNRNDKKETHRYNTNDNYWFTGDSVDFAYGFYNDGYGPQKINVEHKRFIFFKKNEYWLVLDLLDGLQSQKFDVLYHFLPCDFDIDPDNKMISTTFSDGKNILLCSQGTVPLETSIIKGQEGPEQGWISTATEKRLEAPTVVFSGESQLPVLVATLIKPFQGNMDANVNITISRSPEYQAAVIIHADWGEDWWVVNLKNENKITIGVVDEKAKFGFWRIINENIVQEILKDF